MIYKLTSINAAIRKIINDLGISDQEISVDDFIEWSYEALAYIGSYYQFTEKEAEIEISDFRGELPCDFHKMKRISNKKISCGNNFNKSLIVDNGSSVDRSNQANKNSFTSSDYNINHNIITTTYENGTIVIQYLAIPIDCDNLPMIPDDVNYMDALMWKCAYQLGLRGYVFKNPRLNDILFTKQMWNRYCLQARAAGNMPDLDMLERIKNITQRLIPNKNMYDSDFGGLGTKERYNLNGRTLYR